MRPDDDLEERLDRLESTQALYRVVAEYAHGADNRDLSRFLATFHPDATWDVGVARFVGHDQIRAAIEHQWDSQPQMHHWTSNTSITLTGRDAAEGVSSVAALTRRADGRWLLSAGSYLDSFERRAGSWAIATRRAVVHSSVDVTGDDAGAPPPSGPGSP
ncbi:nuclear transport factor 2 family protein [Isoptericola haloaureus]|uniref:Nuclear transport factor 2 family protein n=1 Tax=Isoptericola haloaureus TaxID=1542902 RepID=A0ABU7Z3X2_9MICO